MLALLTGYIRDLAVSTFTHHFQPHHLTTYQHTHLTSLVQAGLFWETSLVRL